MGDARTPWALRGKPVCPLYNRPLRDDSRRAPVLAQNIARLNEVIVVGREGQIKIG